MQNQDQELMKERAEPILVSRFKDIREKPELDPVVGDFSDILVDAEYREHLFEEAKKSFEFILDKEKFRQEIEQESNKESFSYLKQVRRYGLILKAVYRFVDFDHKCGENLSHFLFLLGQYNDSYWVQPPDDVRQMIEGELNSIELSVNFTDTAGFKEYAQNILADMEKRLHKKKLGIDSFHTLRKEFRLFSNLMQVIAAENCGSEFHWLFYCLFKLSMELGKQHDDLIQQGLKGKVKYDELIVETDPQVVAEFKRLKPFIEKVCGLAE